MNNTKQSLLVGILLLGVAGVSQAFTLEETIKHMLETNPEVQAALNEYRSRTHEVRGARAGYLPEVNLIAGIGRETREAPATGNEEVDFTRREAGVQARQMLFDGFATAKEVKRQKARTKSARYTSYATAENLALRTAEVYLNVLRFTELLDLTRETLWEHQNIYDQMKLRSDKGVGSRADLDQIASRLALANSNMIVAQTNLTDAQSNFYRLTSLYPNLENLQKPQPKDSLPASLEQALEEAVASHPTLKSANEDIQAAKAQYQASAGNYWPTVQLEADKNWDENVGGIEGDDEDLIVAVRLNYNLFNGGADSARRRQTAYLVEEARDIRNNARRQVIESLQLSWRAYEAVSAQIKYLQQHVTASKATKKAYAQQFNIGKRTLLDLLNTENEYVDSRQALIEAKYDQLFARYRIHNSMGGLLNKLGVGFDS